MGRAGAAVDKVQQRRSSGPPASPRRHTGAVDGTSIAHRAPFDDDGPKHVGDGTGCRHGLRQWTACQQDVLAAVDHAHRKRALEILKTRGEKSPHALHRRLETEQTPPRSDGRAHE